MKTGYCEICGKKYSYSNNYIRIFPNWFKFPNVCNEHLKPYIKNLKKNSVSNIPSARGQQITKSTSFATIDPNRLRTGFFKGKGTKAWSKWVSTAGPEILWVHDDGWLRKKYWADINNPQDN
jgi:hypothetical protein